MLSLYCFVQTMIVCIGISLRLHNCDAALTQSHDMVGGYFHSWNYIGIASLRCGSDEFQVTFGG